MIFKFYDKNKKEFRNSKVNALDFGNRQTFEIKMNKANFKILSKMY